MLGLCKPHGLDTIIQLLIHCEKHAIHGDHNRQQSSHNVYTNSSFLVIIFCKIIYSKYSLNGLFTNNAFLHIIDRKNNLLNDPATCDLHKLHLLV